MSGWATHTVLSSGGDMEKDKRGRSCGVPELNGVMQLVSCWEMHVVLCS